MTQVRVWRLLGDNDLCFVTTCSVLVAMFLVNDCDTFAEFVDGEYEDQLLTFRQLTTAVQHLA